MITFKQELAALANAVRQAAEEEAIQASGISWKERKRQRANELLARVSVVTNHIKNSQCATVAQIAKDTGLDRRIVTQTIVKLRRDGIVKAAARRYGGREWILAEAIK